MRRLAVLLACAVLAGCGTPSADLFLVKRSGADRKANLTLLVSDGGTVTCNGEEHEISGEALLRARELTRQMSEQAELNLALPAGPNSVLVLQGRMEAGTIAFADTSRPLPRSFTELTVFTKDVSENVCGINRDLTQSHLRSRARCVPWPGCIAHVPDTETPADPPLEGGPARPPFLCNHTPAERRWNSASSKLSCSSLRHIEPLRCVADGNAASTVAIRRSCARGSGLPARAARLGGASMILRDDRWPGRAGPRTSCARRSGAVGAR